MTAMTAMTAIAATAFSLLVSTPAAADNCATKCETSCGTCCSEWTVRGVCASGRTAEEGTYDSMATAKAAADNANLASRAPSSCASERATWAPFCSPDKRIPASQDTPSTTRAIKVRGRLHAESRTLDTAEQSLSRFATERILTAKAQKDVGAANDAVRALRQELAVTKQQAAIATHHDQADTELATMEERSGQLDTRVNAVSSQVRAILEDPTAIDAAAEAKAKRAAELEAAAAAQAAERERQRAEAARAEQARKDERARAAAEAQERAQKAAELAKADAAERARKSAEAADQARAAADARRAAEVDRGRQAIELAAATKLAEETRRKDEADRKRAQEEAAKRAAVVASAADTDAKFTKEHEKAAGQLTTNIDDCAAMIAQMTMLELQPKALPATKAQAGQTKLALQNQKDKLRMQLVKVRGLRDRQPRDVALQELHQAQRESDALVAETAALLAKAKGLH